jgi:hypothetical protein
MIEAAPTMVDFLRRQAERCRRLAGELIARPDAAYELEKLAREFDQRARQLETGAEKPA